MTCLPKKIICLFAISLSLLLLVSCGKKSDPEAMYEEIAGAWYLDGDMSKEHYSLNNDGAFILRSDGETYGGSFIWDGEDVTLTFEDKDKTTTLSLSEENKLYDNSTGEVYIRSFHGIPVNSNAEQDAQG